jgi:hypothetical protein
MSYNRADTILIGCAAGKRMDETESAIELKEKVDRARNSQMTSGPHHGM